MPHGPKIQDLIELLVIINPLNQWHLTKHHPPSYTSIQVYVLVMTKYINHVQLLISSYCGECEHFHFSIIQGIRSTETNFKPRQDKIEVDRKRKNFKGFPLFWEVHNPQAFLNSPVQLNTHVTPGTKIVLLLQLDISWSDLGTSLLMRSP